MPSIQRQDSAVAPILQPHLQWNASAPLLSAHDRDGEHFYGIKDPTIVRFGRRWHIFATLRGQKRSHQIEYLCLSDWDRPTQIERHLLPISSAYFCAPSVFYFRPHQKWYLLYQDSQNQRDSPRRPAFSTNDDIGNWKNWTPPQPLYETTGERVKDWIDFWIICDKAKAFLFFTCDNGTMWRAQTALSQFPHGWSAPVLALQGDIFEASHTYKVRGQQQYLTIIECIGQRRRYYKSFVSPTLDGQWQGVADSWESPFAASHNVLQPGGHWTDSISHGELLRRGFDERMEIEANPQMLFQGVADADMSGKPYGEIPWQLGILTPVSDS